MKKFEIIQTLNSDITLVHALSITLAIHINPRRWEVFIYNIARFNLIFLLLRFKSSSFKTCPGDFKRTNKFFPVVKASQIVWPLAVSLQLYCHARYVLPTRNPLGKIWDPTIQLLCSCCVFSYSTYSAF